jgi:RNA polymerase sigma-70 factor (ECF subfamily)
MPDNAAFIDLMERMRAGDEWAAAEVVRRYQPALRLAVRVRLTHPALRRRLDPLDVCQMVLATFFERAAQGRYALNSPGQLLKLLTGMARNQLLQEVRAFRAGRRGGHLTQQADAREGDFVDPGPGPGQEAAGRELLQLFHSRLSEEERWLTEQRCLGRGWPELAAETGEQPDALRVRYSRKVRQVARRLGFGA